MPTNLHRYYGAGYLPFVTTSCYQRRAPPGTPQNRDLFLEVMERVRRHRFVVGGYVVMPEHVHLLFSGTHSPKTAASGAASVVAVPGIKH